VEGKSGYSQNRESIRQKYSGSISIGDKTISLKRGSGPDEIRGTPLEKRHLANCDRTRYCFRNRLPLLSFSKNLVSILRHIRMIYVIVIYRWYKEGKIHKNAANRCFLFNAALLYA